MPSLARSWKVPLALVGVALFVASIKLMQTGAQSFAPVLKDHFDVETPVGALGFGWSAAYVLLSGSPVAAIAITFFDAGEIDRIAAFAMITGSRLGAAFIVLLLGFFYVLYRRDPMRDLRIGLLALIVTASIYLPAFGLGWGVLESSAFDSLSGGLEGLGGLLDTRPLEQLQEEARDRLPAWAVFLTGLVLIIASFKILDLSLPAMDAENGELGRVRSHVYKRWPMFGLGALITLLTTSVSVSLGLLVPLHDRRIVRPKHVVPYIMGANITTFVDTLVVGMAMERSEAFGIVLVEMAAVTAVSLVIFVFVYERFEGAMLAAVDRITAGRGSLAVFVGALVAIPLALLLLPRLL